MDTFEKILPLALTLLLAGDLRVVAREELTDQPSNGERGVHSNQIVKGVNAKGIRHRVGFFRPEECQIDDGLIVSFKDGSVSANTMGDGLIGGRISREMMTFHVGNEQCQITIQIRRRGDQ